MCRGNYQSQWAGEGSFYEMVAERYFGRSKVDGFFLQVRRCALRRRLRAPLRYMPKLRLPGFVVNVLLVRYRAPFLVMAGCGFFLGSIGHFCCISGLYLFLGDSIFRPRAEIRIAQPELRPTR